LLFDMADSGIAKATREFGELVKLSDDELAFRNRVLRLPLPVAGEYLTFLRAIEGRISEATVEWASPTPDQHGIAVIRPLGIGKAIEAMIDLQEIARTFDVTGRLISGNVEKKTYEFVADEVEPNANLERFSGSATVEAINAMRGFNERYRATIAEVRHMKSGGGVELKYMLKTLRPLAEDGT
jgi:hypothetical protein